MSQTRELDAVLRTDLSAFIEKAFLTVSPGYDFKPNWHIDAIAEHLRRSFTGDIRRLMITQPPRSLKSISTSIAYVAWALGHDPKQRFLVISYSDELAGDLARQFRVIIQSDWYKRLFPRMRLVSDTQTKAITTESGYRMALSICGSLTGRGADTIIIDDPIKPEDAASEAIRRSVVDWYRSTLVTRPNDKTQDRMILVMQRVHEVDLAGYLLATEPAYWQHLNLPAIAIEDQTILIGPNQVHHRKKGDLLHPQREPQEVLDRLKAALGSLMFAAQYQQEPLPFDGNIVRRDWINWYDPATIGLKGKTIVQSWDIATSEGQSADYSVGTTWATDWKSYYLLDVFRDRLNAPALKRRIITLGRNHSAKAVLIEKNGLGNPMLQDLRDEHHRGFPKPMGIRAEKDKLSRMMGASMRFESGQVYLPKEAPWLGAYMHEILAFPHGKNDDQVDSTSQFLNWAMRRNSLFDSVVAAPIHIEA